MTENSLTAKTLTGIKWSYTSTLFNSIAQIGLTSVMARLLDPDAFGLVAMAGVVLSFGQYFAQMGIGQALIQKRNLTDFDIRAGFTSSFILGAIFFALFWLLAPFVGSYYKNETVVPIIRALACSFIINGLSTTANSLLRRNLDFRSIAITEIVSYLIGYGGVGISMACNGFGAWSLVASSLTQSAISAVFCNIFARHNHIFVFQWKHFSPLYSYGGKVSFVSVLEFFGSSLDTFFIGRFLGSVWLGLYNRAFLLSNIVVQNSISSLSRVLFPVFSQLNNEKERLSANYLIILQLSGALIFPTSFGMVAAADNIVLILLGPKWVSAIPLVRILALIVPFHFLTHFAGVVLDSTSKLNIKIVIQCLYICLLGILYLCFVKHGIYAIAISLAIGTLFRHIAYMYITFKLLNIKMSEVGRIYGGPVISGIVTSAVIYSISYYLKAFTVNTFVMLFMQIIAGAAMLLFSFRVWPQKRIATLITGRFYCDRPNKLQQLIYKCLAFKPIKV